MKFKTSSKIWDVINDPLFKGFGRKIFPLHQNIDQTLSLDQLSLILPWYSHVNPEKTVEVINYFHTQLSQNACVYYDIYTEEERIRDPSKNETGLFFFKGEAHQPFAILNAGGGFSYVAAIHDSFPHALELSKKGYNAFALIYRPTFHLALNDLARAIAFVFENAELLEINTTHYSLWGGSAGARLAAYMGSHSCAQFNEKAYPYPSTIIMQYTGLQEVYKPNVATYACVGDQDWIASYDVMRRRIEGIQSHGKAATIEVFKGLSHGFGLGEHTIADGWINRAIEFWEEQSIEMRK